MPVAVVKLGSSIVAEDTGALRLSVVARICEEIASLHHAGVDVIVVTSGAIARGIHMLGLSARPRAVEELQAASAVGQGRLYRTYDEYLRERGIQSAQVLLTFFDMSARTHYLNARRTLRKLVEWRIVPVINENDTTTTDEISFGDNDFLAAQVAVLVDASLLLLLTSTSGLFTADPRSDSSARLVETVSDPAELAALSISTATSALGSGGMRSKVAAAEMATAAGIPTVIGSGFEPGVLARAWAGEEAGTRFAPHPVRQPSFKLWLKYAKPSQGVVVVDAGAARALRDGGTSLLPVGIVAGRGRVRGGRRGRRPRGGLGGREGHLELLRGGAAAGDGDEVRPGPRGAAAGDGRGRAPGLLRAGVGTRVSPRAARRARPSVPATGGPLVIGAAGERGSGRVAVVFIPAMGSKPPRTWPRQDGCRFLDLRSSTRTPRWRRRGRVGCRSCRVWRPNRPRGARSPAIRAWRAGVRVPQAATASSSRENTTSPPTRTSRIDSSRASVKIAPKAASHDGESSSTASSVDPTSGRSSTRSAALPARKVAAHLTQPQRVRARGRREVEQMRRPEHVALLADHLDVVGDEALLEHREAGAGADVGAHAEAHAVLDVAGHREDAGRQEGVARRAMRDGCPGSSQAVKLVV